MKKRNRRTISVSVDVEDIEYLELAAFKKDMSLSMLLRQVIKGHKGRYGGKK